MIKRRFVEMLPVVADFLAIIAIACGNAPITSEPQTKYGFPPTPTPAYKLSSVQVTLDLARARWESKGSDDYTVEYEWRRLHPACGTPIKLTVKNGAVESATYLNSDEALHPDLARYKEFAPTIDDLFDMIQRALNIRAYFVSAKYDPFLGYPKAVGIDYDYDTVDDEIDLTIDSYEPEM